MAAFILLVTCNIAFSQVWHVANQKTIGWDEVTTFMNGAPIPEGDYIAYEVYIVLYTEPKENAELKDTVQLTEAVVTIENEGKYFVGLRTLRVPEGETDIIRSERIAWSDNPMDCANEEAFGIKFYWQPANVGGMRVD